MAANGRYMELVNGRFTPVSQERVREDPALLTGQVDRAADFVEMQDPQRWTDCFKLNGAIYDVNVCSCLHPTIICRAMEEELPHRMASSRHVNDMVAAFKTKMGDTNFLIVNSGSHRENQKVVKISTGGASQHSRRFDGWCYQG